MWPTHYIPNQTRIDGEPPPKIVLTTPPYPYEFGDSMAAEGAVVAITPGLGAEDELTSQGSALSGVIQDILIGFDGGRDEMAAEAAAVSGVLNDILVAFDAGRDEIVSAGSALSGVMTDPLVRYENWPLGVDTEDLYAVGSAVSGALA